MAANQVEVRVGVAGVQTAAQQLNQLQGEFARFQGTLQSIANLSIGGIGLQQLASGLKSLVDEADNMKDMAVRTAMSVQELGRWKLVADQSGASIETFGKGIKTLSTYMVENGEKLKAAGITAKDANGAFLQLSDLFAAMPEGVERTALATELFGKAGSELLPVLVQGSAAIEEQQQKAEAYAAALGRLAPQADEFNDQLAELSLNLKAAGMNAAEYFMPGMIGLSQWLNDLAKGGDSARAALKWLLDESTMAKLAWLIPGGPLALKAASALADRYGGDGAGGSRTSSGKIGPRTGALSVDDELALGAANEKSIEAMRKADAILAKKTKTVKEHSDAVKLHNEILRNWEKIEGELGRALEKNAKTIIEETIEALDPLNHFNREMDKRIQSINDDTAALTLNAAQLRELQVQRALEAAGLEEGTEKWQRYGEEMRAALERNAQAQMAAEAAAEWKRVSDQIGQSLTDAIFNGGKNAGELLQDYFRTLVLRPIIQGTVNSILGSIGLGGGSAGGALSLFNAGGNSASLGGLISGAGSFLGSSSLNAFGAGMQVGSGSLVGGAALDAGVTAGAGGLAGSAGSFIGSALPWIGGALAIYSMLAGKSTPHIGGMAEYSAAGGLQTGKVAGLYDTRSGFGGNKAATDSQAIGVASQTAQGIVGLLDMVSQAFGGSGGFRVGTGYADDSSSDRAWGALRIMQGDNKVLDWGDTRSSRWAARTFSNGQAGVQEYNVALAGSVRQVLDQMDLPAWADGILDKLGAGATMEQIAQAVTEIAATADILDKLTAPMPDFMQAVEDAGLTAFGAWQRGGDQIRDFASSLDGSTTQLSQLGDMMQERYASEVQLMRQLKDMAQGTADQFAGSVRSVKLSVLDPQGQYDFLDAEAARTRDTLATLTDPALITQYAGRLNDTIMQAWGVLSPEQQQAQSEEFVQRLEAADALAQARYDAASQTIVAERQALAAAIETAITTAMNRAADRIAEAATRPQTVIIRTDPAETGY